ncbi:MAG TPA: sugar-transfer associated ATP-grasp domain-containing protein [Trueperaceae bacterium]|nr:sugar-transfer associated ATP-grasp domain-containing protein [Trueperaceae bacterium]
MRLKPLSGLRSLLAGTSSPASTRQRLKAWRHGFSGTTWLLFDLDNRSPADYVPDNKAAAMAAIDGPVARSVLRNKLLFERVVGQFVRVPAVLAAFERGVVTGLAPGWDVSDAAGVVDRVRSSGEGVALKPMDSSEGRGVHTLEVVDGRLLLDKREATDEEAVRAVAAADGALITELVRQDGFSANVFPGAVNTARVVTMIDPQDGQPFVASALHRFGTSRSAPTDNTSRGAIRCVIDVATGRLSRGGASWAFEDGRLAVFDAHPDTGVPLTGVTLEGWHEVVETLLGVVRRLPFLVYVGWDVALTTSGPVVIEGNHSPNITQQVAGPYLADPRVRRVLHRYGVIA